MVYELLLSAAVLGPMPCGKADARPAPACRPDREPPVAGRGVLPPRSDRDGIFRAAEILTDIDRRHLDEADRDLLFMAARAGNVQHLQAKYSWLSSAQIEALVRAASPEEGQPSCQGPAGATELFWIGEREVEPGETVELRPAWTDRPGSFENIPDACVTGLTVSAGAPATILRTERRLQVSADARHGTRFTVQGTVGDEAVSGQLRVIVPSAAPMVGTWTQESIACANDASPGPNSVHSSHRSPVRELIIRGDNTFAVTWLQPFESYHDYWGDYRWDAEQATVEFTVEHGNRLPRMFDGSGTVRRDGDRLVFTDVDFGEPEKSLPATGCEIAFSRR